MPRPTTYSYSRTIHWQDIAGRAVLGIVFLAALVLIIFGRAEDSSTAQARQSAAGWFSGITHFISSPADTTARVASNFKQFMANTQRASQFEEQSALLAQWQKRAEQLQAENDSFRRLLHVAPTEDARHLTARVYGNSTGPYRRQLYLAAGAEDGVSENMAAIDENGLVGRVLAVQASSTQLLSVTDIQSRVAVITGKSREHAVVKGLGNSQMGLFYLPEDTQIELGEMLYTSGDGGLMPANIAVGRVTDIGVDSITVTPAIDPARLEYVRLIAVTP